MSQQERMDMPSVIEEKFLLLSLIIKAFHFLEVDNCLVFGHPPLN